MTMKRISSIEDFLTYQDHLIACRDPHIPTIIIPTGTCGYAAGANDLVRTAKREILYNHLTKKVHVRITGCHGYCQMEPSVLIEPKRTFYPNVDANSMMQIIEAVVEGGIAEDLLFRDPVTNTIIEKQDDIPFFKKQKRILLRMNELVDPIRIDEYIINGGYCSLVHALTHGKQESIFDAIEKTRMKSAAGEKHEEIFIAEKWKRFADQPIQHGKYVVCNVDRRFAGSAPDRILLEGNPQLAIESMLLCAFATSAANGIIFVPHENQLAIKHVTIALRQAYDFGILGSNIFGTGFSFDVIMLLDFKNVMSGNESATVAAIDGTIILKSTTPIESGIDSKPTLIHSVGTWSRIPMVIKECAQHRGSAGSDHVTGTMLLSLSGQVKNAGVIEVSKNISVSEIVNKIGDGMKNDRPLKAIYMTGESDKFISPEMLSDSARDERSSLSGSIMSVRDMVILDHNTCLVDLTKHVLDRMRTEYFDVCQSCRDGHQSMYTTLDEIIKGVGTVSLLRLLEERAYALSTSCTCGLGKRSADTVLSSLKNFHEEFMHHIIEKRCDAHVCEELV